MILLRALPLAALALAGCQPTPTEIAGATLRVDIAGNSTDPDGRPRQAIVQATQRGLTDFDGAGRVVPGLASSWRVSNDGRSVIFRLRDAAWADGRKVTATDVVAVFRRIAAPASTNALKPYLGGVENAAAVAAGTLPPRALGIDAPVENVVEIRLNTPAPELLALLALPDAAIVRAGPRPPALGAFTLADAAARPIVLTRNLKFAGSATVALGRIELLPVDDPGVAVARFARDRTDVVIGSGLAGLSEARLLGSQVLRLEPAWGVYGYLANAARGPTADPRIRRALAMAVSREGLGQRLFGVATMAPALSVVPPGLPSQPTPTQPDWAALDRASRLEIAQQLLTGSGYMDAKALTVTVTLPPGREHAAVLAAVAADWSAIGVRTVTRELEPAAFALALKRGDFELALVERTAAVDTPAFFLAPFRCGANSAGFCNADADALLAAPAPDLAARAAATAAAEATLLADTPLIALFTAVRWSLVQPRVTGWENNTSGQHPLAKLGIGPERRRSLP